MRSSRWLFVPPPLLFVGAFVAGIKLGGVVPVPLVPHEAELGGRWLGMALVACAAMLIVSAVGMFVFRRTTIVPHSSRASSLVAVGPFRVTRNPMYLGLAVASLGGALIANTFWPLVLLAFPLWVMNWRVIPHEEAMLSRIFGDGFTAYQQRVRRWI